MRGKLALKTFSFALSATVVTSLVTFLSVLVLPKFIGVEDFSYWQLYLFYISYVGILHFGWADGIYLRYGGSEYRNLDKQVIGAQFWLILVFETLIMLGIALGAMIFVPEGPRELILIFTGINCLLLNVRAFIQFLLQGTNRIKEFARNVILEKLIFVSLSTAMLLLGANQFEYFLYADTFAKFVMLLSLCFVCKDIVFAKPQGITKAIKEAMRNIFSGVNLLLANIASLLIIGIFRFAIERQWDVIVFGKTSLILSIATMLMIFINAASVTIFPIIKRTSLENRSQIYHMLRTILMTISLGFLVLYYPIYVALNYWLPDYSDFLVYLVILLPLCVYEAKNQLLTGTYLKVFRKERSMLMVNIISLLVAAVVVFVTAFVIRDIVFVLFGLLGVIMFRSFFGEIIVSRAIKFNMLKDMIYEILLTIGFVISGILIGGLIGSGLYVAMYLAYLFIKRQDIASSIRLFRGNRSDNSKIPEVNNRDRKKS